LGGRSLSVQVVSWDWLHQWWPRSPAFSLVVCVGRRVGVVWVMRAR
jgi:hypothetical protein